MTGAGGAAVLAVVPAVVLRTLPGGSGSAPTHQGWGECTDETPSPASADLRPTITASQTRLQLSRLYLSVGRSLRPSVRQSVSQSVRHLVGSCPTVRRPVCAAAPAAPVAAEATVASDSRLTALITLMGLPG